MMPAFRPTEGVGVTVADDGTTVYVARMPAGPILVLQGVGAVIWGEATEAPADGWIDRVADAFGVPAAAVAADVLSFVHGLTARGLLEETERTPTG
jgi:hypothetical protein